MPGKIKNSQECTRAHATPDQDGPAPPARRRSWSGPRPRFPCPACTDSAVSRIPLVGYVTGWWMISGMEGRKPAKPWPYQRHIVKAQHGQLGARQWLHAETAKFGRCCDEHVRHSLYVRLLLDGSQPNSQRATTAQAQRKLSKLQGAAPRALCYAATNRIHTDTRPHTASSGTDPVPCGYAIHVEWP